MSQGVLIAIDGPSGSGKSTVAKAVANTLGLTYLDTGAMYRALTWWCLKNGLNLAEQESVRALADSLDFSLADGPNGPQFFVGDTEVTQEIRQPGIAEKVSLVARNLPVRAWMAQEQRRLLLQARATGPGMVAEGRDITTVVCPDADVRILLIADEAERLRRRTQELYGEVTPDLLAATSKQIGERDRSDAQVATFFTAAAGVTTIDSSTKSVAEIVAEITTLAAAS